MFILYFNIKLNGLMTLSDNYYCLSIKVISIVYYLDICNME